MAKKSGTQKAREQAGRGSHKRHAQDLRSIDADTRQMRTDAATRAREARVMAVPTSRIMRSTGTYAHRGAEVAEMLATGQWRTQTRGRDAAGKLREDVGSTVRTLDYRTRKLDSRRPGKPE